MPIDLSILIVSHGHEAMLGDCVASLTPALAGLSHELVLVDNLANGTAETMLRSFGPGVVKDIVALQNPEPVGFAENVNRAATRARGEYLLILNPDTTHHSGRLAQAIEFLRANPEVGVLSCQLLNPDGSVQQNYRRFPTLPVILCRILAADRWPWQPAFYRQRMMQGAVISTPSVVDWVFGAFILIRRSHFCAVGGMDAGFRLYYEDVDLCYRLRERNLRTVLLPDLHFTHRHMRSSARRPFGQTGRWHLCSAFRFLRRHGYVFRPPVESSWH